MLLRFICCFLLLLSAGAVRARDAGLTVDAGQRLGPISPYVYGANYGPPYLVPLDLYPQAEASGVTYFRIPAGRWGDVNDLTPDMIDLYQSQAEQWGMALAITARLPGSGGTPEKAADLVRYTLEKGYPVRYWAIGNEPDLIAAYQGVDRLDFSTYPMDLYNSDWRATAEAMRAVNPDIVLLGPDVSQFPPTRAGDPYNNIRREWVRSFLAANGDLVDIVTVHRYPFPLDRTSATTIEQLRANPPEWDVMVENLRAVIRDSLGRDLPIAVTEVNSHWTNSGGGLASPDSFYNAVWWADVLGRLIRQRVEIVAYFNFQSIGSNGAFGLLERYRVRPTYYVYQLYRQLGQELVASESADPDVSVTAALRADGALTVLVVNRAPDERTLPLALAGFTPSAEAEVWRLDADHSAEQLDAVMLAGGSALTLPGQSVSLYVIPGASDAG